ncbi:MAG: hypothetical protein JHC93_06255 [Parachlamydiales bacterium]|nr:hypothetical protein [Parachlamydiales bacterium]
MGRVSSIINPLSSSYPTYKDFKKLKGRDRAITVACTAFSTLALGIGAIPTFSLCVKRFSHQKRPRAVSVFTTTKSTTIEDYSKTFDYDNYSKPLIVKYEDIQKAVAPLGKIVTINQRMYGSDHMFVIEFDRPIYVGSDHGIPLEKTPFLLLKELDKDGVPISEVNIINSQFMAVDILGIQVGSFKPWEETNPVNDPFFDGLFENEILKKNVSQESPPQVIVTLFLDWLKTSCKEIASKGVILSERPAPNRVKLYDVQKSYLQSNYKPWVDYPWKSVLVDNTDQ